MEDALMNTLQWNVTFPSGSFYRYIPMVVVSKMQPLLSLTIMTYQGVLCGARVERIEVSLQVGLHQSLNSTR